jgi:outer membrane lipoprotein-sorting protein
LLAADAAPQAAKLTAAQIVEKNVAARGGLQAWRGVQTVSWNGKMDVGYGDSAARAARYVSNAQLSHIAKKKLLEPQDAASKPDAAKQIQLPFLLEMKRPSKSRVEIEFDGKTSIQVYDGSSGWMMRPYLNRNDWEPFSPDQAKEEAANSGLDGPLIDYAQKGTKVEFESVVPVEGHNAYQLKLTMKNGDVRHVWIDAQSFLDVKVEGTPRRMDGRMRTVWVYQRDFRSVQGLMVPFVLETAVDGYKDTHKMVIEKVSLNPVLDDSMFARPKS